MTIGQLSRERAFLLLRYTLIAATAYLVLVERDFQPPPVAVALLVAGALASNVMLASLRAAPTPRMNALLVLVDTMWITGTLVLSGRFSADFFYLYFFVLLLAALGDNLILLAVSTVLASGAYLYLLNISGQGWSLWNSPTLVRIPFLFTVAAFYGYLVSQSRIQVERILRASEHRFRALVENATDAIALLDRNGTLIYVSPPGSSMFGRPYGENIGRNVFAMMHPDDAVVIGERLARLSEQMGATAAGEFRYRHTDGSWRWLTAVARNLLDDPAIGAIVVNYRDVTERKRAEETLRASEERYRVLAEMTSDYTYAFRIEADGRVVTEWVTPAFTHISGYTVEEVYALGGGIAVVHPEDRPAALRRVQRLLAGEADVTEYRIVTKSGAVRWLEDHGRPLWDEAQGRVARVMSAARDITERKLAEEELRRHVYRERAIAEFGQYALRCDDLAALGHDATCVVADMLNVSHCTLLERLADGRMQPKAAFGSDVPLADDIRMQTFTSLADYVLEAGGAVIVEDFRTENRFEVPRPIGDEAIVSGLGVLIQGAHGPLGALSAGSTTCRKFTVEDVAFLQAVANVLCAAIDRKRAQEEIRQINDELEHRIRERTRQLEAANRELEAFSYSVSHDLRAPLRSISGFSRILLDDYGARLDTVAQDHLRRIQESTKRMGELIEALLGLSRMGRQDLDLEPVDLSHLAREIVAGLCERDPARQVEVAVQDGLTAHGDRRLLRVVLENLLGNAWKYTAKTASPRIDLGSMGRESNATHGEGRARMATFFVRDNGAGFDMAYAGKLFGAFQRLHSPDEFEGTGIGLATVRRIIHRHGGQVWAEAQVEKGATFYFTLPEATAVGPAASRFST